MKFTSDIGIGLKFDIIYFLGGKDNISIATINRNARNQLALNSTRIRFDVNKVAPVSEAMVYCTSNIQE